MVDFTISRMLCNFSSQIGGVNFEGKKKRQPYRSFHFTMVLLTMA